MKMNIDNKAIVEALLTENGYIDLIAHGTSMLPTIVDGEQIRITKSESFTVGDIVAYWTEDEINIIVHRIVYIHKKKGVYQRG